VAVGALEPEFFAELLATLGLDPDDVGPQRDESRWPHMRTLFADRFARRTRDEWAVTFAGIDACVTPVLSMAEAVADPHLTARNVLIEVDGTVQPAPAPRFSRTPQPLPQPNHNVASLETLWQD
jgi:alpha-methylacyl-CoA racemase